MSIALLLGGCATVSPERGHDEVGQLMVERAGTSTGWEKGTPDDAAIATRVDALLSAGPPRTPNLTPLRRWRWAR